MGSKENTPQIDIQNLVEVIRRGVQNRGACLDTGIVHHDIEPAVFADSGINKPLEVFQLAHVSLHPIARTAVGTNLLLQGLGGLGMGAVVDHHLGSQLGQPLDDGFTNAAVPTGHNGNLALELGGEGLAGKGVGAGHGVSPGVACLAKPKAIEPIL